MLAILTLLMPVLSQVLGKIIPDTAAAASATIELQKALVEHQGDIERAVADAAKAQNEVNLAEAQSGSLFVSGWRPAVGWVCVGGTVYGFILQPILAWATGIVAALAAAAIPAPPSLDMTTLLGLLTGLLGLGTLRTVEKVQGVERKDLPAARRAK